MPNPHNMQAVSHTQISEGSSLDDDGDDDNDVNRNNGDGTWR